MKVIVNSTQQVIKILVSEGGGGGSVPGPPGNGIESITLIDTVGLVKTYQILFTNGDTFNYDVSDGADGDTGNGISNIELFNTAGLVKTYRITFTDSSTFDFNVTDGENGESAYVYIAYASDDSGTDFTTTFDPALDYIAIKSTTVEIVTPIASDFTGLWKNYKGEPGEGIESGTKETNTVTFEQDWVIGNAAARTGNILFDFTGAKLGSETEMRHNDASAFTFPASAMLMFDSADISTTVDNFFLFVLTDKTASSEVVKVFHALEGGV